MLFSGKENVFMCLVVFQKIFRKIFSGVWKMLQGKDKTRKTNTAPRLTLDARLGSTAQCFAGSSPMTAPSIAIDGAISQSVDRDLAKCRADRDRCEASSRSRIAIDGAGACERRRLELGACERCELVILLPLALSLSLSRSLSLSLWNSFEVKIGTEIHFRIQSLFFLGNGNQFLENSIFRTNQTPAFPEKHFRKSFFTQNKHSLSITNFP